MWKQYRPGNQKWGAKLRSHRQRVHAISKLHIPDKSQVTKSRKQLLSKNRKTSTANSVALSATGMPTQASAAPKNILEGFHSWEHWRATSASKQSLIPTTCIPSEPVYYAIHPYVLWRLGLHQVLIKQSALEQDSIRGCLCHHRGPRESNICHCARSRHMKPGTGTMILALTCPYLHAALIL